MAHEISANSAMHNISTVIEAREDMVNQLISCNNPAVNKALEELEQCFTNVIVEYAKLLLRKEDNNG